MIHKHRAYRRWRREVVKRRVLGYWAYGLRESGPDPRRVGLVATTPQSCSCPLCGNRRQLEGPTVQERRWMQEMP